MNQERILVRGLNWLGDAIMCMPALHRLREARPHAHITMLTPSNLADIWTSPLIDSVLTLEPKESVSDVARRLRAENYSVALILPLSLRSALETWMAGIPTRIGIQHRGRGLLLSHSVPKAPGITDMRKRSHREVRRLAERPAARAPARVPVQSHHVYRYLSLVGVLGADTEPLPPRLALPEMETRSLLPAFGLEPRSPASPLYGLCPGGAYGGSKRWPEERFVEAARALHVRSGCRWLLLGAPGDFAACARIATALHAVAPGAGVWNLAGKTTLTELAGLLTCCDLLLGNDSGPMHLAAAVGTPVATLFSSTSASLTGPGLPGDAKHFLLSSTAPCSPCFLRECPIDMRCMDSLRTGEMVDGIIRLVSKNEANRTTLLKPDN